MTAGRQAEGTELASQVADLRAQLSESHRSAAAERERLLTSLSEQQQAVTSLRAEKDAVQTRLHEKEGEVYETRMQVEAAKQHLQMEVHRLTTESELLKERLNSQAALERETISHKHELRVQALQESLRKGEEGLVQFKRDAEEQRQRMAEEFAGLQSKMSDLQGEAHGAQERLEQSLAELKAAHEALEEEHRELQVEKGLLIGSNKNLNERVEGLLKYIEDQSCSYEERRQADESERARVMDRLQREHQTCVQRLESQIKALQDELSNSMQQHEDKAKCNDAALVIQRRFRRSKMARLVGAKTQTEAELQQVQRRAEELNMYKMALEAQRMAGMASTGRQLVQHTFMFAQNTINDVLTAFLVPKKELEHAEKFFRARERLSGSSPSPNTVKSTSSSGSNTPRRQSQGSLPPYLSSGGRRTSYGSLPPLPTQQTSQHNSDVNS